MRNLIVCPRCSKVIAYNSYFDAYICGNCDYVERCDEGDCKGEKTTWLDDAFSKQEEISWKREGADISVDKINIGDTFVYIPMKNSLVFRLVKKCEEIVKHEGAEEIQRTYAVVNLLTDELKEFTQQDFPVGFVFPAKILGGKKGGT